MSPYFRCGLRLVVLAVLATALACAPPAPAGSPQAVATRSVFPGENWDSIADLRSAGWSPAGLDSVRDSLATLSSTGFVAIVGSAPHRSRP